jgi:preprotein translocase subunit SecA
VSSAKACNNALGFVYFEGEDVEKPFDRDPALASVRQIAHELKRTFADQLDLDRATGRDKLLRQNRAVVVSASVGRNDPCPCGSGKKYKRCHGS